MARFESRKSCRRRCFSGDKRMESATDWMIVRGAVRQSGARVTDAFVFFSGPVFFCMRPCRGGVS